MEIKKPRGLRGHTLRIYDIPQDREKFPHVRSLRPSVPSRISIAHAGDFVKCKVFRQWEIYFLFAGINNTSRS